MVELVVLGATGIAIAALRAVEAHRRRVAGDVLERYALRRGHGFAPGDRRAGPRVLVREGELIVDFCRIRGELRTRVSAPTTRGRAPRVAIVQRGGTLVTLGTADGASLLADCEAPLRKLLPRGSVSLASDGRRVALTWRGIEQDFEALDAAITATAAASRWHDPTLPYRG